MSAPGALQRQAERTLGNPGDVVLRAVRDAEVVLVGEASHGTHEFYRERAELTKRLIDEEGFGAIAVEADWPDALRVSRFVTGESDDPDAVEALGGFVRFPTWMWRNADVVDFVGWLRERNDALPREQRVGFFGLDLYSLRASIEAVVGYLDRVDPEAAQRARRSYECFDLAGDPSDYGYAVGLGLQSPCREEVLAQLLDLQRRAAEYVRGDGKAATDEYFYAEQNARVARDAEEYYRTMLDREVSSWNVRDAHMFATLEQLVAHLERTGRDKRVVVWAHNSHVGNAYATEMGRRGEYNIGALARERYGKRCRLVGFTTYEGTVSAASDWGEAVERKRVRPGLAGSYEELFHRVGLPHFAVTFEEEGVREACRGPLLERAIGVIYRPDTERFSHYFRSELPEQFDAVMHIDRTHALEPLERTPLWEGGEVPETYPTGV